MDSKNLKWTRKYNDRQGKRYTDEIKEGTMLHTKAIVAKETNNWYDIALKHPGGVKVGIEWPDDKDDTTDPTYKTTIHGAQYHPNCFPVPKIDNYWVPKLTERLEKRGKPKYDF